MNIHTYGRYMRQPTPTIAEMFSELAVIIWALLVRKSHFLNKLVSIM